MARILLGVTGGIAAYKAAQLTSLLIKQDHTVRVIMTDSATRFITPLTLRTLSGQPVLTSMWDADDHPESQHIGLARWADLMLIAPCSATTLAGLAHATADNLVTLTATALPATTPLALAPAMNADMWANPLVQRNLQLLTDHLPNLTVIDPEDGWQACRTSGPGRMAEPETIADRLAALVSTPRRQDAKTPRAGFASSEPIRHFLDPATFTPIAQSKAIPDRAGFYAIAINDIHALPDPYRDAINHRPHRLLYVGRSQRSLLYTVHPPNPGTHGPANFFTSVGAMLGYRSVPGSYHEAGRMFQFGDADALAIAHWTEQHCSISCFIMPTKQLDDHEPRLVEELQPLLNLNHNPGRLAELKQARHRCSEQAKS
ncbi:MAG: flavoprotein [Planctomycetota bacterium]